MVPEDVNFPNLRKVFWFALTPNPLEIPVLSSDVTLKILAVEAPS